jgi:hypothetical protein
MSRLWNWLCKLFQYNLTNIVLLCKRIPGTGKWRCNDPKREKDFSLQMHIFML